MKTKKQTKEEYSDLDTALNGKDEVDFKTVALGLICGSIVYFIVIFAIMVIAGGAL